jgi:hypothetical protein
MQTEMAKIECVCEGTFEHSAILVNGRRLTPDRSQEVWNHSPGGFAWGYAGSGPAQLALAILLEFVPEKAAVRVHQRFKEAFIMGLPQDNGWTIRLDVEDWVATKLAASDELYLLDEEAP